MNNPKRYPPETAKEKAGLGTRIASRLSLGYVDKIDSNEKCGQKSNALHKREVRYLGAAACRWSYWSDSNRRPAHYECAALPTEPQ